MNFPWSAHMPTYTRVLTKQFLPLHSHVTRILNKYPHYLHVSTQLLKLSLIILVFNRFSSILKNQTGRIVYVKYGTCFQADLAYNAVR